MRLQLTKSTSIQGILLASLLLLGLSTAVMAASPPEANLASGKSYTIEALVPDPLFATMQERFPDDGGELTDGVYGIPDLSHAAWQILSRQAGRTVVLDLGAENTLRRLSASFLHARGAGIYFPRYVDYALSSDGKAWAEAGRVETKVSLTSTENARQSYELNGLNVVARYVRLSVPVDVFLMIDEFEVWGTDGVSATAVRPQAIPASGEPKGQGYLKPGTPQVGGARHIVLLTSGYYKDQALTTWSVADYRPYVAYVDQSGKAKDWFFDTALIWTQGSTSSGRSFTGYPPNSVPANKADWLENADWNYRPGYQLAALNQAVGELKVELKDPNYKLKVVLDLLYTNPYQRDFGDVDGDGRSENFDQTAVGVEEALANRTAVTNWFLNLLLSRWKDAKFDNLELIGFYWHRESVPYMHGDAEDRVVQNAAKLVHDAGYKLFWIPFGHAEGFLDWRNLGIDAAMVQPNYMFAEVGKERLGAIAKAASEHGMGVEIEKHWFTRPGEEQKFIDYLNAGVEYGYMNNALIGWYQNTKDIGNASRSRVARTRQVYYDWVYEFVKGTYTER